ncbi:hypothetical protein N7509_002927 [Penicillium cosmopolitanum]|uniref:Nephrocystin 3-like N-terminal domain-containing protein n=1 Tax=Penicillium cosmopolitanum TaxID=1131564 RepID=A0A9W9W9Z1_9EURO|nr:uncharacterized protein N7509_002927 [Penicillium cosmopolitanum]KAJ5409044.1 hypothetical protein N7509_002927 [Penicillium cosmopolitanum]
MDSMSMSFGNALSSLQLGSNHGGTINFNSPVILKSLAFPQMLDRRDNIEQCHASTCEWILEMEEYKTWMGSRHGLLWVKGKPGAGKSTLMAFLYEKLEKFPENDQRGAIQLDFFFTARGTELQRTPLGMFRSLLNQIYASDETVRCAVREAYEKRCRLFGHNDEHKWPQKTLEELLTSAILTSANQKQVRVFVDALDETGAESAPQLAAYFHRLSTRAEKEKVSVQICISCRHYPIIASPQAVEICVEDHNRRDIATYIDDVLADMENEEDITETMKEELMKELTGRANGVFQWVHIMLPLLQQRVLDGDSLDEVSSWLNEVPADLEEVYTYILNNVIDERNRGQSFLLFQWLCFAERSLTLTEVRYALVAENTKILLSPKPWEKVEGFVDSDKRMKRKLKALSGGLVEVVSGQEKSDNSAWGFDGPLQLVQVVHQSVNDFLSNKGLELLHLSADKSSSLECDTAPFSKFQATLYRSCLVYFATSNTPRKLTKKQLIQSYPFLAYATENLFIHAEKSAESRIDVLNNEIDTLQRLFDRWLSIHRCFSEESTSQDTFPPLGTKLSHVAALYNLVDVIEWLASNSNDLGSEDSDGNTAFHFAARRGHITVAKILRQNGADCGVKNTKSGKTPLIEAAENGNLEFVEWLLTGGVNLDQAAHDEGSALHAASENGHHAVVTMLLEAGADVNTQGGLFGNALQAATYYGNIEAVQLLLDAGADVNARGGEYGNALQAAARQGNIKVVQLLLDTSANVNAQGGKYGNALQAAARHRNIKVVQILLDAHADVNAQGGRYGNALQASAFNGDTKVVQILLDAHADVNAQGGRYGNALQASAFNGDIKVVKILLDAGADVNSQCATYASALQIASFYGDIEIVQILLDAHADVNAQGGRYGSALQAAESGGRITIVQVLLTAGAREI